MEISAYIDALDRDGTLLADAADAAGLDAVIPGCPGWRVRDLVRHQAYVHDWAARHVRDRSPAPIDDELTEADILGRGPADADLIAAYRAGHAALVATLRDADPDVECATFMAAPSPPAPAAAFGPAFAADGVDELIMGFAARPRYRPQGDGVERSLTVRAQDTEGGWHLRLTDGGSTVSRLASGPADAAGPEADCTLDGPAAGLYAFLWNRSDADRAGLTVAGRPEILASWNASVRVRW